jgi:maltokinase-like protein
MIRMALLHRATLRPTKLELLAEWLPTRLWYTPSPGEPQRIAGYRFDDPADAVGIETMLIRVGDGPLHQVPLTYRAEPLTGATAWLIGTAEHSVLGTRWIYDATGDPVYATALTTAILTNSGQAAEHFQTDEGLVPRAPTMTITGTPTTQPLPTITALHQVGGNDPGVLVTDTVELTIRRRLDTAITLTGSVLTGTWPGQDTPVPLAAVTPRR